MSTLNFTQIEQLWTQAGGSAGWAPLAAGIAMAESGGNTTALNNTPATGDYSVGLWQINYYDGLLGPRTQAYGSPQNLLASPQAQAKAAVSLSGNGSNWGPWRTDRAWNAWTAAGSPSQPSAATVQGWLKGAGVPTGGGAPGALTSDPGATSQPPSATGCSQGQSPPPCRVSFPLSFSTPLGSVGGCLLDACQVKAIISLFAMAAGVGVGVFGAIVLAAWGFQASGAKATVGKVAGLVPGLGTPVRAATAAAGGAGARGGRSQPVRTTSPPAASVPTAGRRESRDIDRRFADAERQIGRIGPRGGNATSRRVAYEQRRGTSVPGGGRPRTPEQVARARERAEQPF